MPTVQQVHFQPEMPCSVVNIALQFANGSDTLHAWALRVY